MYHANQEKAPSIAYDASGPIPKCSDAYFQVYRPYTWKETLKKAAFTCIALLLTIYLGAVGLYQNSVVLEVDNYSKKPPFGKDTEKIFLSVPNAASAMAAARIYASAPHMAGTNGDFATAKAFLSILEQELDIEPPPQSPIFSAGSPESRNATLSIAQLDRPRAWIDTYYPVMNTPLDRSLEILDSDGSVHWKADLEEYSDETDEDAHRYSSTIPTFHGLSSSGDVHGRLIHANYGRKEDYDALVAQGVNFTGSIVIARYGGSFRGLKVQGAQELGAAGILIYSDPRDDGTVTALNGYTPYPHGPARNPTSVQRGSVQFLSIYPGDPTTPGFPAYENSTRTNGSNIPSIPSLPLSWNNAQVLLETLDENSPIYGKEVHLVNNVNTKVTPIWNTMGVIPGHIRDEVIVIGNHRDAWVLGATDPSSGTVSVNEVIRGFGVLLKKGWKPMRTIVIASWDAEEYGLIGSTEYGEDFKEWIKKHVVAYLNLDSSVSGSRCRASASPLLAHVVRKSAEDIAHPTKAGRSLWDATKDDGVLFSNRSDGVVYMDQESASVSAAEPISGYIGVSPMGSGSDFTVFLQHLGVASSAYGFSSTLHDPVYHYHSVFDSVRWQELYGDPLYARHVAIAQHFGLQTLRIADSVILPFNTTYYADELDFYLERVQEISSKQEFDVDLTKLRGSIRTLKIASVALDLEKHKAEFRLWHAIHKWKRRHSKFNKFKKIAKNIVCSIGELFGHACDSSRSSRTEGLADYSNKGFRTRPRFGHAVGVHLEEQERAERDLVVAYTGLDDVDVFAQRGFSKEWRRLIRAVKRVRAVNAKLIAFERGFISKEGLKGREFYKHLGVAPGRYLGYGATTLPALTESLTLDKNTTSAQEEADRLKLLIDQLANTIHIKSKQA